VWGFFSLFLVFGVLVWLVYFFFFFGGCGFFSVFFSVVFFFSFCFGGVFFWAFVWFSLERLPPAEWSFQTLSHTSVVGTRTQLDKTETFRNEESPPLERKWKAPEFFGYLESFREVDLILEPF